MFRSIRWRIGLPYVLLIIITMIGLSIYLSNFLRQTYLANLETDLAAEARLASEIIVQYLSDDFSSELVDQLAKTWAKEIGTRVTIIALDGTVVGESHDNRAEMDNHINRPEVEQALESGQGISTRYSQTLGDYLMYVAVPAIKDGRVIGIVRVALPMSEIEATVQHLLNTEGVNSAAYKITRINPPEIFIRLEDGYEIKKILFKAIETLRTEVTEVQQIFKKLT